MLDSNLKSQLKSYLERLTRPVVIVASPNDTPKSAEMMELLAEIAELSDKIAVQADGAAERRPSFALTSPGHDISLSFAGLPMGHEFTSLVLALLHSGGHPPKVEDAVLDQVKALDGDFHFETYFSLSCQNCPDVVQALNIMAVFNPNVTHTAIDGSLFKAEVDERQVMAVPSVYLNGEPFAQGRQELEQILAKLDTNAGARMAEAIAEKDE